MKCLNCNSKIKDGSKYCIRCGYVIGDYTPKKEELFERKLYNAYTGGKNYNKDTSWLCFFLSFIYLFYKKMYVEGAFCLIAISFLSFFLPNILGIIFDSMGYYFFITLFIIVICVGIIVYYAQNFNTIYTREVMCNVNKIMIDNSEKSEQEIINICKEKGKPNFLLAVFSPILWLLFSFFINYILQYLFYT